MKSSHRLLSIVLSVPIITSCAANTSETGGTFTAQDSLAVVASADKYVSTTLARDFDGWATTVTPDVVLYPPNAKAVVGREAAVEFVKAFPPVTKFTIDTKEVSGRGDLAYDHGTYMLTLSLPNGAAVNDTGSFFSTFRRQPDGTWAHSVTMWRSNLPVPTPPPPAPTRPRP